MLKNLAVSQSAPTGAHSESERALRLALAKIGIACDEILVLGELPEIYLTVSGNPAQKRICRAAENALGVPFSLSAKRSVAQDKAAKQTAATQLPYSGSTNAPSFARSPTEWAAERMRGAFPIVRSIF